MSVEAMALPKPQSFEHKADVFDDGCAHDFNVDAMVFPALPDLPPFPESPWSGTNSESIEEHPSWDHEVVGATQLPKSQLSEIKGDVLECGSGQLTFYKCLFLIRSKSLWEMKTDSKIDFLVWYCVGFPT